MNPTIQVQQGGGGVHMVPYPPGPLTSQPVAVCPTSVNNPNYMPMPSGLPPCPPGLEYLTMVDQLLVHQQIELLEVLTNFETNNRYTIKNSMGQIVYHALEDTDCCTRNCFGSIRPFDIKIVDYRGMEVIHLSRDLRCSSCCFPCCLQQMEVTAPPGTPVGTVEQDWSLITPLYSIKDLSGNTIFRIEGPICICCSDAVFKVSSPDGNVIGNITKQWSGLLQEIFTDADNFGITFPLGTNVHHKVLLLGALFLIDFMYFERSGNNND